METSELRLKSCHGEIITCSVKEVIKHESGRIEYRMDNKKCNDFHNSQFDDEATKELKKLESKIDKLINK